MKKNVFTVGIVLTLIFVFLVTGSVFAQGNNPTTPGTGAGFGGMMGGRGMQGGPADGSGILHETMVAYFADKLDLTVEDLNARIAGGESMAQIATTEGLTYDEFRTLMLEARDTAIDQAVEDGTLTQEQADWMKQRSSRMAGRMGRGMRGGYAGSGACPYFNHTTP